jgi:pyrroloquinoline quinone biosynthesis protein D
MTGVGGEVPAGGTLQVRPRLAKHVRLTHDRHRDRWVLQAPERLLVLDETALEVIRRVDGRSVAALVTELAEVYDAPAEEIAADVLTLIADLREKGIIVDS